jgi:hypothetical protein
MKLKNFTALPKFFVSKKLPNIHTIKLLSIDIIDNNKLLNFLVPSSNLKTNYTSSILIDTENQINGNIECKFNCTCDSFKYEYSAMLNTHDSLIDKIINLKIPKHPKLFVCKHLFVAIQILFKHNNISNLTNYFRIKSI